MNNEVNINEELNQIKLHLRQLSIPDLQEIMPGVGDFMHEMGEMITPLSLSDAIVNIHNTAIFEDKKIRDKLTEIHDLPNLSRWNNGKKCRDALSHMNLSDVFLPQASITRELFKDNSPESPMHDYQNWLKKKVSKMIVFEDKRKLMVQMPTGAGKTWTMMESIYDYFRLSEIQNPGVIWLAHTDELCEQAIESFNIGWDKKGSFDVTSLRLWGGNIGKISQIPSGPFFAVLSFQSAYSMITSTKDKMDDIFQTLRQRSNLIIIDEAHLALAETYRFNLEQLQKHDSKIVGLTATPGRHGINETNKETAALANFFDKNIKNLKEFCLEKEQQTPIEYLQSRGILSKVEYAPLKTDYDIELNQSEKSILARTLELPDSVLASAAKDNQRNGIIVAHIIKLVREHNKKILVFAPTKDNASFLAALLNLRGINARSVTGETSASHRKRAVKDFREKKFDVLLNFGVFTTGFDDPSIDCVLIARPTASVVLYSQMVGRGLRGPMNGGTPDCLLVDVIDNLEKQPDLILASKFFQDAWE